MLSEHKTCPECGQSPGLPCLVLTTLVIHNHTDPWNASGMSCCPRLQGWQDALPPARLPRSSVALARCTGSVRWSHSWARGLIFVTIKAGLEMMLEELEMSSQILAYPAHCRGGRRELCGRVLEAEIMTLQVDLPLNLSIRETGEPLARLSC